MANFKSRLTQSTPLAGNPVFAGALPKVFGALIRAKINIGKMRCYTAAELEPAEE